MLSAPYSWVLEQSEDVFLPCAFLLSRIDRELTLCEAILTARLRILPGHLDLGRKEDDPALLPKLSTWSFPSQAQEEARRNRLMRDMAQLRLQVGNQSPSPPSALDLVIA